MLLKREPSTSGGNLHHLLKREPSTSGDDLYGLLKRDNMQTSYQGDEIGSAMHKREPGGTAKKLETLL
jgi:hypothetical protein